MPSWWLIECAIAARSTADVDSLNAALSDLVESDANLSFAVDKDSGQFLVHAMCENHLDDAISRLRDSDSLHFNVGAPQVAYREQIGRAVRIDYVHKRIVSPTGEFAKVVIDFAPATAGGFRFENKAGSAVPAEFVPSVEEGLKLACQNGVRAGFPLVDIAATLVGGAYHHIDSSSRAFKIAAQGAVRKLKDDGDVQLAEPWMSVEVVVPEELVGLIAGDLNARRGVIQDRRANGGIVTVCAVAPLANMLGYMSTLNAISKGRATVAMQLCEYRAIPDPDDNPPFKPAIGMRA